MTVLPQNSSPPTAPTLQRSAARSLSLPRRAGLIGAGLLTLLLGAGDSFHERQQRIEGMTAIERAALKHNFDVFKTLSDADRRKYATLDKELQDDGRNGGNLDRIMQNYAVWLRTISPVQRERLRQEEDPGRKMQLVREFYEQQQKQHESRPAPRSGSGPGPGFGPFAGRMPFGGPRVSPEQFQSMMAVLEKRASVPPDKRKQLEAMPDPQRHLKVLEMAMNRDGAKFPDEALQRDLIAASGDEQTQRRYRELQRPEMQRFFVDGLLMRGLAAEWQPELEKHRPSQGDLDKMLGELEPKHREQISQMGSEEVRRYLGWQYFARHADELPPELKEFVRFQHRLAPKEPRGGNDRRPPGGRRPGDGPPSERPEPPPK